MAIGEKNGNTAESFTYVVMPMSYQDLTYGLFGFFTLTEAYFLWINYTGRFRYKLMEKNPIWRWFDKKIGVWSLILETILDFGIIGFSFLTGMFVPISVPAVIAFISFFIGIKLTNAVFDFDDQCSFKETCLICEHVEQCRDFHNRYCKKEGLKQAIQSAIVHKKL